MGNVHMEASQINYRGGETKMSVEEAIKAGSSYELPIASVATLGGVKIGSGISIAEGGAISADAQLPSDPETDGMKVLTATTSEGATTKSWAEPYTGFDYSTSEVNTGQKWIDGKDIYCKVYTTPLGNNTTITLETGFAPTKTLVKIEPIALGVDNYLHYQFVMGSMASINDIIICEVYANNLQVVIRDNYSAYTGYFAVYYTKTTV